MYDSFRVIITGTEVAGGDAECEETCLLFVFFRDESVPLASEPFGEPGRFRGEDFLDESVCFWRPDGVLLPLVDSFWFFSSSAAFCSCCFNSSASVSSELYDSIH